MAPRAPNAAFSLVILVLYLRRSWSHVVRDFSVLVPLPDHAEQDIIEIQRVGFTGRKLAKGPGTGGMEARCSRDADSSRGEISFEPRHM
jgi:hypothetical protein